LELPDEDSDEGEEAISEELSKLAELDSELAEMEQAFNESRQQIAVKICKADFKWGIKSPKSDKNIYYQ
jgi:hypothetical protein